jgi:tetratricopeptide (TPR) repeat protein
MADGNQCLERKEWAFAEKAFNGAIKVTGYENDSEARSKLKQCEDYRNTNETLFKNAVLEGGSALSDNDFEKALKFFEEALKIPGYVDNNATIKQRDQAKFNLELKNKFESAMNEGRQCLDRKEWRSAETAFLNALSVPGYANNNAVIESINVARKSPIAEEYRKKIDEINSSIQIVKQQCAQAKIDYDAAVMQYDKARDDFQKKVKDANARKRKPPTESSKSLCLPAAFLFLSKSGKLIILTGTPSISTSLRFL